MNNSAKDETNSKNIPKPKPMPLLPITSMETINLCKNLPLTETDIFICSYPKSGTTWTQHIVISLLLQETKKQIPYNHVSDFAPFFEIDAHWDSNNLKEHIRQNHELIGRRIFNTHLRWDMLPSKAKFIYLIRSPLDVCVSFYAHLFNQIEGGYNDAFDSFFTQWLNGEIAFGSWSDHILSFASAFPSEHILLISYKDMIEDLSKVVNRLMSFLELDIKDNLDDLIASFSFDEMKRDINKFQPKSVSWKNGFCFLRKGNIGDGMDSGMISEEQRKMFFDWVEEKDLKGRLTEMLGDEELNQFLELLE